ncbi:MAG: Crp/Fnr family transcriptional regulator [Bacteroidaceae bacterium]|nr:Crp/Fnr family transcriptional regulator [Bacteroidaceae bacterium]
MDTLLRDTINSVADSRFPEMSTEGRSFLEKILVRKEIEKGEIYLKEGEISQDLIFVGKGMLRQFYFKSNRDVTEHFSYEGCVVICIESLFKQIPTHLMIEALEPSIVYLFPYSKALKLSQGSLEMNIFCRKILEYSLIMSQQKIDGIRFETASERYNRLIEQDPEIIKRVPMNHIASYLLMSPETLSRVRSGVL